MAVRIHSAAELEMTEAALWYFDQRPGLGDSFLDEAAAAIERANDDPLRHARLEGFSGEDDVRRCLLNRFPYLLVFRHSRWETLIVAVSHVRRRPFYWLERLAE